MSNLIFLLGGDVQDHIRGPLPFLLDQVPHLLNGIKSAALWREVLRNEVVVKYVVEMS